MIARALLPNSRDLTASSRLCEKCCSISLSELCAYGSLANGSGSAGSGSGSGSGSVTDSDSSSDSDDVSDSTADSQSESLSDTDSDAVSALDSSAVAGATFGSGSVTDAMFPCFSEAGVAGSIGDFVSAMAAVPVAFSVWALTGKENAAVSNSGIMSIVIFFI